MSKLFLDQLEAPNGFAKLNTLVGITRGVFKSTECGAVVGECDDKTFVIELFFHAIEAVTFASEHVFFFELNVVEQDLAAAIHAQAQFFQLVDLHARFAHIHKPFRENRFIR